MSIKNPGHKMSCFRFIHVCIFCCVVWHSMCNDIAAHPHNSSFLDCDAIERLLDTDAEPFARGAKKEVLKAMLHGAPLVIARPVRAPRRPSGHSASADERHSIAYFRSERSLLERADSPYLPKLLGGCSHENALARGRIPARVHGCGNRRQCWMV